MASDASVIMGDNPWKNVAQLYDEKINGTKVFNNAAMQRGTDLEPKARKWAEAHFNSFFLPCVYESGLHSWMAASLDGLCFDGDLLIEIKCGMKSHELAKKGEIPDYYKWQMYHQMEVMNMDKVMYISYQSDDDVIVIPFERCDVMIEAMILAEKRFYVDHLMNKVSPSEVEDILACEDEARRMGIICDFEFIEKLSKEIKSMEELRDMAKLALINKCNGKSIVLGDYKCTKYEVKGSIDYSSIPELKDVNLEAYRKPGRQQWKIT